MTPKELESLYQEVEQKLHLLKGVKVMKFPKDSEGPKEPKEQSTSRKASKKPTKKKK